MSGPESQRHRERSTISLCVSGLWVVDVKDVGAVVEHFASGWKQHYYGKGDVIVYRLKRDGQTPDGVSPVFGANVLMLVYGDAFWPTYTTGDNTGLIATDSMKNFIQRETLSVHGAGPRRLLPLPRREVPRPVPAGGRRAGDSGRDSVRGRWRDVRRCIPGRAGARPRADRVGPRRDRRRSRQASAGFRLLRLGGSAFHGFVRDEYTTLPEITEPPAPHVARPRVALRRSPDAAFTDGRIVSQARRVVTDVFQSFESGSIQQMIYQMGTKIARRHPRDRGSAPRGEQPHLGHRDRAWRRGRRLHRRATAVRMPRSEAEADVGWRGSRLTSSTRRTASPPPASTIELHHRARRPRSRSRQATTNADGRTDAPLARRRSPRTRRLRADLSRGRLLPPLRRLAADPPFLGEVVIRVGIADAAGNYHVPLLLSPYGYSTYRGT